MTKQVMKAITVCKNGILATKVHAFATADIDDRLSERARNMGSVLETFSGSFSDEEYNDNGTMIINTQYIKQ